MRRFARILAGLAGAALFAWLVWRAGPGEIGRMLGRLGWQAPLLLLPFGVVFLWDTLGWKLAWAGELPAAVTFRRLLRVRLAGEAVNAIIPTGYVGGEAVKVLLLQRQGASGWAGAAAAVNSKTTQTVAQIGFLALGAALGWSLLPSGSAVRGPMLAVATLSVFALGLMFWVQQRGVFVCARAVAGWIPAVRAALDRHADSLRGLDARIRDFVRRQPRAFGGSTAAYLMGWLCDPLEMYLVARLLGWPLSFPEAVGIEAFVSVAKGLGVFVPGAVGVQESGVLLLFRAYGLGDAEAVAYALIRRGRELVFALAGFLFLWADGARLGRLHERLHPHSP